VKFSQDFTYQKLLKSVFDRVIQKIKRMRFLRRTVYCYLSCQNSLHWILVTITGGCVFNYWFALDLIITVQPYNALFDEEITNLCDLGDILTTFV